MPASSCFVGCSEAARVFELKASLKVAFANRFANELVSTRQDQEGRTDNLSVVNSASTVNPRNSAGQEEMTPNALENR